jgi:hypothetical protein
MPEKLSNPKLWIVTFLSLIGLLYVNMMGIVGSLYPTLYKRESNRIRYFIY